MNPPLGVVLCPECKGKGTIILRPGTRGYARRTCTGCFGAGTPPKK